jgi:hypothetical protein
MMCALVPLSGKRIKQAVERFTVGLKLRTKMGFIDHNKACGVTFFPSFLITLRVKWQENRLF